MKRFFTKEKLLLFFIFLFALFTRLYDVNWDQGNHLHPDERFLTMVGVSMQLPTNPVQYFDPHTSLMNPANINYAFYVYGIFPVVLNKLIAIFWHADTYELYTIQGRILSAFTDTIIVLLVFLTAKLLEQKQKLSPRIKYYASFLYAIAVLPIQLAHFFAVDTFLNLFVFASFYCALLFWYSHKLEKMLLSAIFLGLAFACKISALYTLPLILFFIVFGFHNFSIHNHPFLKKLFRHDSIKGKITLSVGSLLLYFFVFYIVLRVADPYLFETKNVFDPTISHLFQQNIATLTSWSNPQAQFPPSIQWIHRPRILFALNNIMFYGLGLPYFLLTLLGGYWLMRNRKNIIFAVIIFWILLFFFYQSWQFSDSMRYFLLLYPFFALLAGIGTEYLRQSIPRIILIPLLLTVLLWPLAFFSIYTKPISRFTATVWIYQNIPNQSFILSEHWDDGLPLLLLQNEGKIFPGEQLPVFDIDDKTKWIRMNELLNKGDYYILSSNRGWGSIPTVPERYPKMTKFYQDLFANKLPYKEIAEFTSYPSLRYLGIPLDFPDQSAEEAFTVIDHPKIMIFKNTSHRYSY